MDRYLKNPMYDDPQDQEVCDCGEEECICNENDDDGDRGDWLYEQWKDRKIQEEWDAEQNND